MLLTSVDAIDGYFTGIKPKDGTADMELADYVGKMGTGAVDAWKFLMNIEGTPSWQVRIGKTELDLKAVAGAPSAALKNVSVEMDQASRDALGITGELRAGDGRLTLNCTKSGAGILLIKADSEGTSIERRISVICRPVVSGNGGWL